jgi:predicted alpha/beta-hydrolase family hydrolase
VGNFRAMPRRQFLFAHGAGAASSSAWMQRWAERLAALGDVTRFDYPYMARGSRRPDPQDALIEAHRSALAALRGKSAAAPLVLAGKSMGSRIGCHVANLEPIAALVCFGYPLKAAGSGKLRDRVLLELRTPILFVQGTRDPLCPLELLEPLCRSMSAPNHLHVVEGGDHSLETGRGKRDREARLERVEAPIVDAIRDFVDRYA